MPVKNTSQAFYEIRVEGALGSLWQGWFDGLEIRQETSAEDGLPVTVFSGWVPDPPALYGILGRISGLNLSLVSVIRIKTSSPRSGEQANQGNSQ